MMLLRPTSARKFWRNLMLYSVEYTVILLQILLTGKISGFTIRPPDGETTPVPAILNTHTDNVSAIVGGRAILKCKVTNLGTKTVVWRKADKKDPLTIGTLTYNPDKRFQVRNLPHLDEWNLIIKDVKRKDSGVYECQISSKDRSIREQVYLTVQDVKPDIIPDTYINSGNDWFKLMSNNYLPFTTGSSNPVGVEISHLPSWLPEGISISNTTYVEKGDRILLECNATSGDVDWFKKGQKVITDDEKGIKITKQLVMMRRMITSTLQVEKATMDDDTDFVCRASDMQTSYVKVHVLNGPKSRTRTIGLSFKRYQNWHDKERDKRDPKIYSNGTGASQSYGVRMVSSKVIFLLSSVTTVALIHLLVCR